MYSVNIKNDIMDCRICGEEIHPKRLEILPGTKTCVSCSTTSHKIGAIVVGGEGDHTWNDLMVMDEDQYNQYEESKKEKKGKGFDKLTD